MFVCGHYAVRSRAEPLRHVNYIQYISIAYPQYENSQAISAQAVRIDRENHNEKRFNDRMWANVADRGIVFQRKQQESNEKVGTNKNRSENRLRE